MHRRNLWSFSIPILGLVAIAIYLIESKASHSSATSSGLANHHPTLQIKSLMEKSHSDDSQKSQAPALQSLNLSMEAPERQQFYSEIATVFGSMTISGASAEQLNAALSRLNERGQLGLKEVVRSLSKPARTDPEVRERLFLVDYLNYRLRWDEEAKAAAIQLASCSIPNSTPLRYRATTIAEQAEIIEGIARVDWNTAADLIGQSKNRQIRRLASSAAYYHFIETGLDEGEALTRVRSVNPEFKI